MCGKRHRCLHRGGLANGNVTNQHVHGLFRCSSNWPPSLPCCQCYIGVAAQPILNFVTFIRALEQCCGVVVGITLFENRFNSLVQAHLESGSLPLPFVISGRYAGYALVEIRNLPFIFVDIHRSIYSDSVKPVWYTGMGLDAIASAPCFYIRRASLGLHHQPAVHTIITQLLRFPLAPEVMPQTNTRWRQLIILIYEA